MGIIIKHFFHKFLNFCQREEIQSDINSNNIVKENSDYHKLFNLSINPLRILKYFTYIDLYSVLYKGRAVYFFKLDKKIYVLSKSFLLFDIIDIYDFQDFVLEGRHSLKLRFYNTLMKDVQIRHFSRSNVLHLAKNIYPLNHNPAEDYHFIKHSITSLLNIKLLSRRMLNFMVNVAKRVISKSPLYYHREVYEMLNFNIKDSMTNYRNLSNKMRRKLFFSIFFVSTHLKSLNVVYNSVYPFRNKLYFSKKKVMNMDENNPLRVLYYQNEARFERPTSSVADLIDSLEDADLANTSYGNGIRLKKERKPFLYKKHTPILKSSRISSIIYDPQYIEIFNYLSINSEKIDLVCKPRNNSVKFEKVVFNITIPKSFGKKEHKTLELSSNGSFIISDRDRV